MQTFDDVARFFRQHEVGRRAWIETPYGRRLLCYGDLTATGLSLDFVEAWVRQLHPYYANTHTAISSTGRVMTGLREEARRVIQRAVNAAPDDVVLFVGSGATAALNKLVGVIGLRIAEPLERAYQLSRAIPAADRPVVLVGPYEHHSNELPWIESVAEVVEVSLCPEGTIDLADLRRKLSLFADRPLKIGAFSAGSNVTGVLSDVRALARTLHAAGAFAVFDYAAAAPYVPIDMHPPTPEERLDAIALSPHKFVGGPQASGVLVAHQSLFRSRVPERPGGGTVDYVAGPHPASIDYTARLTEREEGGTPAIVGDIRAGIAFVVKEMIGPARIVAHDTAMAARALARLSAHARIQILGPLDLPRLGILSFNIKGLHHDLVSSLLDHLFGIQNRSGCACAGPYGHRLLGIDPARSERYRAEIARGNLGVKPGWVRLTLPYHGSAEDIDFMLEAVELVAEHGDAFVPCYRLGWHDGIWRHVDRPVPDIAPIALTAAALRETAQTSSAGDPGAPFSEQELRAERARYFREARALVDSLRARWSREPPRFNPPTGRPDLDELIWFKYVHTDGPVR